MWHTAPSPSHDDKPLPPPPPPLLPPPHRNSLRPLSTLCLPTDRHDHRGVVPSHLSSFSAAGPCAWALCQEPLRDQQMRHSCARDEGNLPAPAVEPETRPQWISRAAEVAPLPAIVNNF